MFKKILDGVRAFFVGAGQVIYHIARQLWALVSDKDWDFDPWKISGFGAFVLAGWTALKVIGLIDKGVTDAAVLGIPAGLVTAFITVGTFLFGQSRTNDKGQ